MNLIYEVSRELGLRLKARKYPFRVHYGPERTNRESNASPVILVCRDRADGEDIQPAVGQQANGRKIATRLQGVEIKIYAQSSLPHATLQEHEELADYLVDAVLVSLYEIAAAEKMGTLEFTEARFMYSNELVTEKGEPEHWPGVVFLLRLKIGRGVLKRDYLKQIRPAAAPTGAGTDVEVRLKSDDPPEVVTVTATPPNP